MARLARRKIATFVAQQLAAGTTAPHLARQVAAYLIEQRRTNEVELLIRDIETVLADTYDSVTLSVTSAHVLSAELAAQLVSFIEAKQPGKHAIITETVVDPELIGGVIIQTPTATFDSSIKSQLQQLTAASV